MSKENNKAGQDNVFKVLRNRKVVSDKLNKASALKAWQDGSLVNNDVLKKMSLAELSKINDMLTKAGY